MVLQVLSKLLRRRKQRNPESRYQIRHSELGVFQGFIEEDYQLWYPFSCCPEVGIYKFNSLKEANDCVDVILEGLKKYHKEGYVTVESYDTNLAAKMAYEIQAVKLALEIMPVGEV